jgi:hypothetical protein
VAIDTIVLVSDGAPTDNDPTAGKLMDHKIILQHGRVEPQKRVDQHRRRSAGRQRVHESGQENGGVFVDR